MEQTELEIKKTNHVKWINGWEGGERLVLTRAVLRGVDLRGADLRGVDLRGADLSDADLSGADLRGADLSDAELTDTDLSHADLSGADLTLADLSENIKVENLFSKIKVSVDSYGALEMGGWHGGCETVDSGGDLEMGGWHGGCKTTHCLAGWVITIADEVGQVMENLLGIPWAAALIINESCPYLKGKVPNFYANNDQSINFINECAAREAFLKGEKL